MSGEIYLVVPTGKAATDTKWVESRDAAKHLTMHREALDNKELSGPK